MKKIFLEIIEAAINLNRYEVINLVKKLSNDLKKEGKTKDSDYINSIIGNTSTSSVNLINNFLILKEEKNNKEITWKKSEYLEKIINFLKDNEKIYKIGAIKIFIVGRPGTGKTSFVKDIAIILKKKLFSINAANLVSHKLGETQKNIEKLLIDIRRNYLNSIFIIDEFDSLIGSRYRDINDEYQRMIGSFNTFLDALPKGTILFSISNKTDSIDSASLRRFNVSIKMNDISLNIFEDELFNLAKTNEIDFKEEVCKKLLNYKIREVDYSMIEKIITMSIIEDFSIEKSISKILELENIQELKKAKLTLQEIENITSISKSSIQRSLKSAGN